MRKLVLISLYVDDREPLAKEYQFTLEYTSGRIRNIETIGQKWAAFQAINFNSVAQPHYILMMPDGTVLAPPQQYTGYSDLFAMVTKWLSKCT
jgi:thiol:disulfide interchange protein DsbD